MTLTPRGKLALLFVFFAAPIVAAWVAFLGWRPDARTNYGTLLPPTPLEHTAGRAFGAPYDLAHLDGKWRMLVIAPAACEAPCGQLLYLMRQTRIAQGREQDRIERIWVVEDGGAPAAAALDRQEGLIVWTPDTPAFVRQFPAPDSPRAHIYLVDPLGNLMLRFPAQPEPKRMMKDLKLLLKASQVG